MTIYTLELEFDINQITRSLQYKFTNSETKTGILAGTFNFNNSGISGEDTLQVSLTATGRATDNPKVVVQDCTLVSVSDGDLGRTFLSPFSQTSAVSKFENWAPLTTTNDGDNRVTLFGAPNFELPILASKGQWEISGYLSVMIEINNVPYYRVFHFDPEGTAGQGSGIGWPG